LGEARAKKISQNKQKVDCLPFYSISTHLFERLVRNAAKPDATDTLVVKYEAFKKSLVDFPGWEGHFEPGTPLSNLLRNPYLH
jgi:hypothetical protein